jgi:hypothetical protein
MWSARGSKMNQDKIKALAMELYKNEEVAIELANVIFGIRDGDYEPEKLKFKFEKGKTYFLGVEDVTNFWNGTDKLNLKHGRYRKTQKGAELSLKRNQRANRLEMLVEYLGGLKEFVEGEENWYISYSNGEYASGYEHEIFDPEKVYMTEEIVIKACDLLNRGAYSLEGA